MRAQNQKYEISEDMHDSDETTAHVRYSPDTSLKIFIINSKKMQMQSQSNNGLTV